jgi:hypothetical protein
LIGVDAIEVHAWLATKVAQMILPRRQSEGILEIPNKMAFIVPPDGGHYLFDTLVLCAKQSCGTS